MVAMHMKEINVNEILVESSPNAVVPTREKVHVLHVDDDSGFLKIAKQCLETDAPVQVDTAVSVEEALKKLEKEKFDVIVCDYQMPGRNGLDLLRTLRSRGNTIPFIIFTGKGREEVAIDALNLGANQYINKTGESGAVYAELSHSILESARTARAEESLRKSEEKLRAIVSASPDAICIFDLEGNVTEINDAAMRLHGFTNKDQILGKSSFEYVAPKDRSRARVIYGKMIENGGAREAQFTLLTVDGRELFAEVAASVVKDPKGLPVCVAVVMRDVTEQKKARESIRRSEQKYKELFDNAFDAMIVLALDGTVNEANNAILRYGYRKGDIIGKNIINLVPKKFHAVLLKDFAQALKGRPTKNEIQIETPGGTIFVEYTASVLTKDQTIEGVLVILRGLDEQRKLEKTVLESQQKFSGLFSGNPEATVFIDPNLNIVEINPRFMSLFGYSPEEARGKQLNDLVVPRNLIKEGKMLDEKAAEGYVYHDTVRKKKDGSLVPVSVSAAPISVEGRLIGYIGVYKDISEQKKALAQFEGLFTGNPEAAAHLGPDFHILNVNPRFEELFGYSLAEIKGKDINEIIVSSEMQDEGRMLDKKASSGYVYFDTVRKKKDATLIPVSVSAAPIFVQDSIIGHIAMYKDISESKRTEAAVREMMEKTAIMNEKLRVVGGLTRHDVHNKLSIITGNLYLDKKLTSDPKLMESFKDMELACNMVVQIFNFAKDYERLGVEELAQIDLEDSIRQSISLFSDLKGVNIMNECHGLTVFADSLLRQLFYNLIDNSLKYGDKLTQIKIHYEEIERKQIKLVYEDDGIGIPQDMKANLFREGFTSGKGTGYGLFLIKKMTEVYGWNIRETGEFGKGARFVITIPKLNEQEKENYQIS